MLTIAEEIRIIAKGAAEIVQPGELEAKLKDARSQGRPLVAKLGLDPSAPDIHLGHTVVLRKLKQIQDLGHQAVLIIGDFTGMIGDPTGKSKSRPQLSQEAVLANARTYREQVFKLLDPQRTRMVFNSAWLAKLGFKEVVELASHSTVARMLEREDFKNRFAAHREIGIHEFFYPLMQAYDSVAIKADIELGGTDQRFNLLMGRNLQRAYHQESQAVIMMPLLAGTDGVEKMSKSLGNYIGINEPPREIFGKVMSIPDALLIPYYELVTDLHPDAITQIRQELTSGKVNPMQVKLNLAREIVRLYHGEPAAGEAKIHFRTVFQRRAIPENPDILEIESSWLSNGEIELAVLLFRTGLTPSKSEARRLLQQGAVRINGVKVTTLEPFLLPPGALMQVGKRKHCRIEER